MTPTTRDSHGGSHRPRTTARFLAPVLGAMLIAGLTFAGCTCAGQPSSSRAPATGAARATPPAVVQTPTAVDLAAVHQKTCDDIVSVLAGRSSGVPLDDKNLRLLAGAAAELVTCGAVARDSDEPCVKLLPTEHGPTKMCFHMRAIFHELRTYPQGRSFFLDEVDCADLAPLRAKMPAAFDALRAATRSGDVAQCEQAGDLRSICRAFVTIDASQCRVEGGLAAEDAGILKYKEGDSKASVKFVLEDWCQQTIQSRAFLSAGLKGLSETGAPRERLLAKAALGDPAACAGYEKDAMSACMDILGAGSRGTPVSGTPAPPAAAPPAGAPPAGAPPATSP